MTYLENLIVVLIGVGAIGTVLGLLAIVADLAMRFASFRAFVRRLSR